MMDDLKEKIQGISAKERGLLATKTKMKWWTVALVLLTLVAMGMFAAVFFPDIVQSTFGIRLKTGDDVATVRSSVAYLGVEIRNLDDGIAEALDLKSSGGVVISRVMSPSPAAEAGLKAGDIILRYERSMVEDSSGFQKMLAAASPGDRVKLVVDRGAQVRTFYVVLGVRPSSVMQTAGMPVAQIDDTVVEWGCTLSPLTSALAQQLSLSSSIKGVVVVAVAPTGLAKSAGILPGDVIASVNREQTQDLAGFYKAIENEESLALEIYRSGQVIYLKIQQSLALPPLATIAGSLTNGESVLSRIAIAANGSDLSAQMALRFGTAPYFIIVDLATNRFATVQNNTVADARGYGIAAAQLVAAQGAQAVIAGTYGPQAYNALKAVNIVPFVANPGKVSDILNQYRSALLTQVIDPTLPGYAYAQTIITTGGPPTSDDDAEDEEEEQSGYKGLPYTIPPQGKYDPALDPANAAELTAGSTLNLNLNQQTQYCYCPTCNIVYEHPASVPCSSLVCKECGSRLISLSSGAGSSQFTTVAGNSLAQRIAIASNGNDLSSPMALRFGTAPYFIVVDLSTNRFVAVRNSALASTGGYGIAAAQLITAQGAQATVAGSYGSQAYYALTALNVVPFVANPGRVSDVLNQYRLSALSRVTVPALPGGNARSIIVTGGPPTSDAEDDEEEEEQSGYKGLPYTIPPQGKYDPALDPASAAQATAGSVTQRVDYCYCPSCGISVPHPAGVSCSQLTCPQCGNRLMNLDASTNLAPGTTGAAQPLPTQPLTTYNQALLPTQPLSTYTQAPLPTQPLPTYTQALLPTQTQTRTGSATAVAPGTLPGSAGSLYLNQQPLYLNQQSQYCYCPLCNTVYEHPAGVPCSSLVCKNCGSRLLSLNPGAGSSLPVPVQTSAGTVVAGIPVAGIPVAGMPVAGMPVAGMPVAGMPVAGMPVAGMPVAGMPETIPPSMGQTSAGMPVSGMPETIPPPGGGNPDNLTVAGIPNVSTGILVAGQPDGIPPSMGQTSAGIPVAGMPVAGMPVSGMPETIPPTGQTSAGTTNLFTGALQGIIDGNCVCPKCGTTVPHLRGTACYTIPCPKCDTLMVNEDAVLNSLGVAAPQYTYPTALATAGIVISGMPETIPPTGQTSSVITVATDAASSALTVAGANSGKVCIAATGSKIDSPVADLFDRAPYFLIVGLGSFTAIPNPNVRDVTGAGIQSAQLVVSEGAKAVITNDIGIKAIEELKKLQVRVYTGVTGTAAQALEWYQNNRLTPTNLNGASSTTDDEEEEEKEEEAHVPPTSKAKAKGETKPL